MSFYAYYETAANTYRERFGLDFEDFQLGQRFQHRPGATLSQQDNVDEALDTLNSAMIHYDNQYAQQTTWKRELMVSTVTLQRLIGMSSKTFAHRKRISRFDEIAMTAPVFGGDTLYADSEIIGVDPNHDADAGTIHVCCRGTNQDDKEVAKVTYRAEVWRTGRAPDAIDAKASEEPRFLAHRETPNGALVEQVGLFFEDCRVGDTFIHWPRRTLLRDEGMQHAWRALELNPQFHDLAWSSKLAADGQPTFMETWLIGVVTAMTTRTFGRVVANLGWTDIEFGVPVRPEDTLEARSTITDSRESNSRPNEGILSVDTIAENQRGETVLSYKRKLLVYKKNADTPYEAAGY